MRYLICLSAVAFLCAERPTLAGDGHGHKVCCPACNYTCEFSAEKVQEKKHCYEVECKPICIPRITLPWQKGHGQGKACDGCSAGCARVKVVRVLVKQEYECTRCKCKWTPVLKGCDKTDYDEAEKVELVPEPTPMEARLEYGNAPASPVRVSQPAASDSQVFAGLLK